MERLKMKTGVMAILSLLLASTTFVSSMQTIESSGAICIGSDGPVDFASRIREIRPAPEVILVIMIDFPDRRGVQQQVYYQNLLFGGTFGTMSDYYEEVSYDLLALTGAMAGAGWYRSSRNMVWWGEDDETWGADNANALILELAREAIARADADVDFKAYDTNNDSIIEPDELSFCIVHAGNDQGPSGVSTDIVSHGWIIYGQGYRWTERGGGDYVDTFVDGCRISKHPGDSTDVGLYFMCAETDFMGTFAHEFAHMLGLPDLYSEKTGWVVGEWSLMDEGGRAPHLDPWSKVQLGWLSPTVVEDYLVTTVDQTESTSGNRLYRVNIEGTQEYFLIENRQQIGYDIYLPEAGVLIWHIDEAMQNNTSIPPMVALEQPGESLDTAAYSSNDGQTTFDSTTTPNSNANDGTATSISVWNIGAEGPSMNVTFFRASEPIEVWGDYTLDRDLTFRENGFIIKVNNTTLNLNGYKAIGSGKGYGALVETSGVTIKNGVIMFFETGINVRGSNNSIVGNNVTANGRGISLLSDRNTIIGNNITNNGDGIFCGSSYNSIILNNITNNRLTGIYFGMASCNRVIRNNIANNGYGIELETSNDNTIIGNSITANNYDGIRLYGLFGGSSDRNRVIRNNIANNGYGIELYDASNNIIYHNNFVNNTYQAIAYKPYQNEWDDDYPSGGNYWSDYLPAILCYDDGYPETQFEFTGTGGIAAVRFTSPMTGIITSCRFYARDISYDPYNWDDEIVKVHVLNANMEDMITPFWWSIAYEAWYDVDLTEYKITVNTDFYIGIECTGVDTQRFRLYADTSSPGGRSCYYLNGAWIQWTEGDYLIRVTIGSGSGTGRDDNADGLGDTPYLIEENNQDRYPLMSPFIQRRTDLNLDRAVNIVDITIVASAYGSELNDSRWNPIADLDGNYVINIIDIAMVAMDFGITY